MNIQIDARGKQCPLPVIETKNAIAGMKEAGTVEVTVDNEIAVQNLTKMANHKGLSARSEKRAEREYMVWIDVTKACAEKNAAGNSGSEAENLKTETDTAEACIPDGRKKNTVVVLGTDHMGEGDEKLGKILMKGFVYALTQLETPPSVMLFYNGGARLTAQDSPCIEDLKTLQEQGTEILTCGTCVNFYGLKEPAVGTVTNMYTIAEKLTKAGKVIRP